eukprot:9605020-Alexandrium_andersonii.AAC.1
MPEGSNSCGARRSGACAARGLPSGLEEWEALEEEETRRMKSNIAVGRGTREAGMPGGRTRSPRGTRRRRPGHALLTHCPGGLEGKELEVHAEEEYPENGPEDRVKRRGLDALEKEGIPEG